MLFLKLGTSIVAGSLTLGIMTLPVVISTAEEALLTVPREFRLVSQSLGASRWQTIRHQVLPHAIPGILTGVILGLSRAAGETAPILFTVAAFYRPDLPHSLSDQTMALPLSPVRDRDAGAGDAALRAVWHGAGAAAAGPVDDADRRRRPHDDAPPPGLVGPMTIKIAVQDVSFTFQDGTQALKHVSLDILVHEIFVLFGPARSGKTVLLRLFNRLADLGESGHLEGAILFNGQNVYERGVNVTDLRRRIGMVFAVPTPLPGSIRENVLYGLKMAGMRDRVVMEERLETLADPGRAVGRGERSPRQVGFCAVRRRRSSGCASRAAWRWNRKCCCSTIRPPGWTRCPPAWSKIRSTNSNGATRL